MMVWDAGTRWLESNNSLVAGKGEKQGTRGCVMRACRWADRSGLDFGLGWVGAKVRRPWPPRGEVNE